MSGTVAGSALARSLQDWQPGSAQLSRRVDPWPAAAFAALIGAPQPALGPGDPLPPMWHWFTLLEHPAQSEIGADGHPARGPFLPPIPGRRRMFAGGRLRLDAPIPVGAELSSRSSVADVSVKSGRSGELAFVTVRQELAVDGSPVGVEEQDIVYRSQPWGTAPRPVPRPEVSAPGPASAPGPVSAPEPAGEWYSELATDEVLLFRFSALIYNAHRIHYDRDYATQVEGFPDLVVHGPLLALLALELPRVHAPARVVRSFEYRLVRPAFQPATLVSAASPSAASPSAASPSAASPGPGAVSPGTTVEAAVGMKGALPSLTARVVLE